MKSLAFSLLVAGASLASAGTYTFTLPEFNGPAGLDANSSYPQPSVNVGVFNFAIPGSEVIVGAELDGQFGNTVNPSTAGVDLYGDGVLVAQALPYGPEWQGGPNPWSYTLSAGELGNLADGLYSLDAIQTNEFVIRLGETTLTIHTEPVPEPATMAALGLGLAAVARRRRK